MPVPGSFRFYDYPGTGLPNTNNTLGGLFSDPKSNRVHSGISKEHRKKLSDENIYGTTDLRHRRRNIRPPATTDQALRAVRPKDRPRA